MFGIQNYEPPFYTSLEDLLSNQGDQLRNLVGKQFLGSWLVWNTYFNSWWTEWPIILIIDQSQLELCTKDMDKLAVTWNTIDVSQPLFEGGSDVSNYLKWRPDAIHELAFVKGRRIQCVQVVEYKHKAEILLDKINPSSVGQTIDFGWLLHGIEFKLDSGYLTISNNLSGHGIDLSSLKGDEFRKTSIDI